MLTRNLAFATVAFGLAALSSVACQAQSSSMFGGRGPTSGTSGIRGSASSAYGLSSGNSPTSGFSATQSGFGSSDSLSPFGVQQFGTSQMGAAGLARTSGANGFQGTNGAANGQTARYGVGNTLGRLGQSGLGRQGLNRQGFNGQNRNRNNQGQNRQDDFANSQVRIRPQVSFPYSERENLAVNTALAGQFDRIGRSNPEFAGIQFTMDSRSEVTLSGTVPREHAGRLAAALVRLEPGVRSVRNELTVVVPR
ncbi:MAG: BON domain-containing protein [Planctomycetaceae bacterium]|nr:BON domain-containing protein [Planctomycetaceae bacterium]